MTSTASSPPFSSKPTEAMEEEERNRHLGFMREALAMAELALSTNETPVGCVFVHENRIVGRGMNATNRTYNGTRHAEFMAVSSILSQPSTSAASSSALDGARGNGAGRGRRYSPEILKECDLYVTVEPCIMCASLLRQVGVRKVFFGASNEKFGGAGGVLHIYRANGRCVDDGKKALEVDEEWGGKKALEVDEDGEGDYEVSGGWLRDEAILLLQRFYMQENERAPEPRARTKKARISGEVEHVVERKVGDG